MKRIVALPLIALFCVTLMFAHGTEKHVMGTVARITGFAITIKTTDGSSIDVVITSTTKFMQGNKAVGAGDLKEGDRVVVHAQKNGDKLEATAIKVGSRHPSQK